MRILGLDTATRCASVGLLVDGEVVAERSEVTYASHAVSLLPLIDTALRQAGCALRDLDAIAVSSGPGSFTGLRVGVSVAKGIACATGLRLVAVPTLEALARTVADHHGVICSLLDARKGELYAACFESSAQGWRRLSPDALVTPESLSAISYTPRVILGDAVTPYAAALRDRFGREVTLLPFETYGPRGGVVATMGWERLQAGHVSDLPSLEPSYVRRAEAELRAP
jgi:tRNA threonylcarbamoyladenosine biosynthesis protein TsaB